MTPTGEVRPYSIIHSFSPAPALRRRVFQAFVSSNVGLVQFVIDNIILIAVAFVSGAMLVWPLVRARASGPTLTTLQATQLMNSRNPQVLDLRNAEEFAKGSLPNARNVPVDRLDRASK